MTEPALRTSAPPTPVPLGGLTSDEAATRLAEYGPNSVEQARPTPVWVRIVAQLRDPLILVLLGAAVLTGLRPTWSNNRAGRAWSWSTTPKHSPPPA